MATAGRSGVVGAATIGCSIASTRSHRPTRWVFVVVDVALSPSRSRSVGPEVGVRLTSRDQRTLRWIADQEAVRTDVIAYLLGGTERLSGGRTRHVVDRWRRAGLLHRERLLAAAGPVCWLTDAGLRLVGTRRRSKPPPVALLDHLHAVSLVRLGVERRGGRAWASERTLAGAGPDGHLADGRFVTPRGVVTAVEVELTLKAARRLRAIIDELTIEYRAVLYVVRGPQVRRAVERAVASLGEQGRVTVVDLARFQLDPE